MIHWFKRRDKKNKSYLTNDEWLAAIKPPPDSSALEILRNHLISGLSVSLQKHLNRDLDHFVQDIAQDSILKILDAYPTFRGGSKFTTWAMKIAIRQGYSELRKKRYSDVSIEHYGYANNEEDSTVEFKDHQAEPDQIAHESIILTKVLKMMEEELSTKQQKVIELLMIEQIPMTVVSEMLGTNRNTIYKQVHDARLKLKKRLEKEGIDPEELLRQL